MKNRNYYLRIIANNTGSNESKMKNDLYYLKKIASNVGADVTGKLKNRIAYLRLIAENTEDYESKDDMAIMLSDKDIIQTGDKVGIMTVVAIDGKVAKNKKVDFYIVE